MQENQAVFPDREALWNSEVFSYLGDETDATGADGLQIEVHNDPAHALCDGPQSLKPEDFDPLAKKLLALHAAVKSLEG